jgi:hypothetical protein
MNTKTTTKVTTAQAIRDAGINIADEISAAVESLRHGDYYGDTLPDAVADIAKSLRILSGREEK